MTVKSTSEQEQRGTSLAWLSDERGLSSLQVVMILAVAAVCLIAIKQWWLPISEYFGALIELLLQD